ncbi:hypothetical protein ABZY58_07475 [Micromonospora tulbaghiae]|uniref:hypothetical protein n=1 Tax=Micromonospora tulbaghiae TaxID=479978 RepID=UPI0033BA80F2
MILLDCEDADSAMRSLAVGAGVDEAALREVLLAHKPDRIEWDASEDPWVATPRAVFAALDVDIAAVRYDGAYYFHGTRVLHPHAFLEDGIRPLGAMLDRLWNDLYRLCAGQVTPTQWSALRRELEGDTRAPLQDEDGAQLYRLKFASPVHQGPFASLVRDHTVEPINGQHDYLRSPEIVEDIAGYIGLGLQRLFEARATSCVVKFRHREVNQHTVEAAMLYLLARVHEQPLDGGSVYGLDCQGAVPAEDVVYIDEINIAGRGSHGSAKVRRHKAASCSRDDPRCRGLDASAIDASGRVVRAAPTL